MTTTIAVHTKNEAPSLARLRKLRGNNRFRFALTSVGDSANAYRKTFQITKLSNPALLKSLSQRLHSGGAVSFIVRTDKRSFPVTATRLTPSLVHYDWAGIYTLITSQDEDDVTSYASMELAVVAVVAIFAIFAVSVVAVTIVNDDDSAEVEAEDRGGGEDGEGDGGEGGEGGEGDGGGDK